jgi:hypothetical protein
MQISTVSSSYIEFSFFLQHIFFIFKIDFVNRFEELREALEKLQLNDAALKVDSLTYLSILPPFIRLALIYCLSSIWSLEHIFSVAQILDIVKLTYYSS